MHHHHGIGTHSHGTVHDHSALAGIDLRELGKGKDRTVAQVALLGLGVNVLLCLVKALVGWVLDSAVLLADATHAASDCLGDLLALFCLYKAQKRPTRKFPLGYGKLETIGSIGISTVLLFSSFGIIVHACNRVVQLVPTPWRAYAMHQSPWLWKSLGSLSVGHSHSHSHAPITANTSAVGLYVLGIVAKEILYRYTYRIARQTHSSVLQASAYHHRVEVLGSLGSLITMAGTWLGLSILDPIGGLILAALYGIGAWQLLCISLQQLCDMSVSDELLSDIQQAFSQALAEVKSMGLPSCEAHALTATSSGRYAVVHVDLVFPANDSAVSHDRNSLYHRSENHDEIQ
ncbi:hypothetical protein MPSI1_001327 [Malassezia psittaci]|uniref:Cation efflux protein transmembrane domain-containing protein n=1 Tax=Malassezia psittaci TaxID=1821823 RepID=A0AAF0FA02_9BASI|nr:hypothetical protein MPSI1_001327 [Malassezia psittaci]